MLFKSRVLLKNRSLGFSTIFMSEYLFSLPHRVFNTQFVNEELTLSKGVVNSDTLGGYSAIEFLNTENA